MSDGGRLLSARCAMLQTITDNQVEILARSDNSPPDGLVFVVTSRSDDGAQTPPVVSYNRFKWILRADGRTLWPLVRTSRICSAIVQLDDTEGKVVCTRCDVASLGSACRWTLLTVAKESNAYKFTLDGQGDKELTSVEVGAYDADAAALFLAEENLKLISGDDRRDGDVKEMIRTLRDERDLGRVAALATKFQLLWLTQHINPTQANLYRYLVRAPIAVWFSGANGIILNGAFALPFPSDDGKPTWKVITGGTEYFVAITGDRVELYEHVPAQTFGGIPIASQLQRRWDVPIIHPIQSGYYNRAIIFTGPLAHVRIVKRGQTDEDVYEPRVLDGKQSFFNEGQRAKVTLRLQDDEFKWRWENSSGTKPMTFTRVLDTPVFESKSGDKLTYHPFGDFS